MKRAPAGAEVKIHYDAPGAVVEPGHALVTTTGRTYVVVRSRQQAGGKHAGRWHLKCVVADDGVPEGATIHLLRWYGRGPARQKDAPPPRSSFKRGGRVNPQRERPRVNEVVDEDFKAFVRTLPCCCGGADERCRGPIHAHHTVRGDDRSCIPLSRWCHLSGRHGGPGGRAGWLGAMTMPEVKRWEREQSERVMALYLARSAA